MKSRWIGLVFVVIFSVLFAFHQYKPGTWLMGWDSLHPEFNYQLAFSRVFNGAWRESQGLGAVTVHSHMSELPRIATLWVIDLFVPINAVRWTYVLLMLVLGVVGSYVLLVHVLSRMRVKLGMGWVTLIAIVGSMAYLFNLSTLHHFLVPFEMFVVLFGLLPWSLWSVSRYLQVSSGSRLTIFLLIQFLISSSAFAATLWVVYFGVLLLTTWFLAKNKKLWLQVLILTLMVNSYWLLPTIFGLVTTGGIVASAKINQVFSPEAWLNNVAYGTAQQVMRLESFILQWMSYDRTENKFDLVVSQWGSGENLKYVWSALNIVAGMVGVGLLRWFYLIVGRRDKESWKWSGLLFAGLLLFMIMLSRVWPVNVGINWARENLPLVGEILRTPFTKVSIFLQLIYSVLIGVGLLWIVEKVKINFARIVIILVSTILIVFPFISWILKGNMLGDVVVTKMPAQYEKLFEATKQMGEGRMMAMPAVNMWGWEYRDWGNSDGYEGANFTQFGIVQSLLIRDFDRWSPYNEGFYDEFSTALYSDNADQVKKVLDKYDVRFSLLDESVIAPGQEDEILRITETKKMMEYLGAKQVFKEGFLTVWDMGSRGDQFVSAPSSYTWAIGDTSKVRRDLIWEGVGTYVSSNRETPPTFGVPTRDSLGSPVEESPGIIYPFSQLMREEVVGVEYGEGEVVISYEETPLAFGVPTRDSLGSPVEESPQLIIPGWKEGEKVELTYSAKIDAGKLVIEWEPVYSVNGQQGPKLANIEYFMGSKTSAWVSIGESPVFVKDQSIKSVAKLKVGEPIQIKIYDGIGKSEDVVLGEKLFCGEGDKFDCYAIPLTRQNKDSLLQTISTYPYASPNMIEVCLDLEGEPYECANKVKTGSSPLIVMQSVDSRERYWLDYVLKSDEVKLEKPQVNWYPIIGTKTVEINAWSEFLSEKNYQLDSNKLEVIVASQARQYDFAKLGKAEVANCDVLGRGRVEKSPYGETPPAFGVPTRDSLGPPVEESPLVSYIADERGAVCDYVDMTDLSTNSSYLMRMMGENVEGRSLKYFLYNTGSKRNDIEYLLGKRKFDQTFALLKWMFDGNYSLNIETRSFGQYAENILEPVEVRWFPLEQIAGARITTLRSDLVGFENGLQPTKSDLRVTEVKKTGTWLYRVKVEGSGLLKLSQGYDEGWIAPPIKHVKVDGWANGWIIENSGEITIFYWPQLLEYLGFVMLGATIWVIYKSK